jgi:hypothetical protein
MTRYGIALVVTLGLATAADAQVIYAAGPSYYAPPGVVMYGPGFYSPGIIQAGVVMPSVTANYYVAPVYRPFWGPAMFPAFVPPPPPPLFLGPRAALYRARYYGW